MSQVVYMQDDVQEILSYSYLIYSSLFFILSLPTGFLPVISVHPWQKIYIINIGGSQKV